MNQDESLLTVACPTHQRAMVVYCLTCDQVYCGYCLEEEDRHRHWAMARREAQQREGA